MTPLILDRPAKWERRYWNSKTQSLTSWCNVVFRRGSWAAEEWSRTEDVISHCDEHNNVRLTMILGQSIVIFYKDGFYAELRAT